MIGISQLLRLKKIMNKIKALCDKYGLTYQQVADKLKYSKSQIERFANAEKDWGSKINRRVLAQLEDWAKELEK